MKIIMGIRKTNAFRNKVVFSKVFYCIIEKGKIMAKNGNKL